MFDRFFNTAMRYGPRILFCAALLMLVGGVVQAIISVGGMVYRTEFGVSYTIASLVYAVGVPASYLFFCALLIERADRMIGRLRSDALPAESAPQRKK